MGHRSRAAMTVAELQLQCITCNKNQQPQQEPARTKLVMLSWTSVVGLPKNQGLGTSGAYLTQPPPQCWLFQESELLKSRKESYQEKLEEYNARLKEVPAGASSGMTQPEWTKCQPRTKKQNMTQPTSSENDEPTIHPPTNNSPTS